MVDRAANGKVTALHVYVQLDRSETEALSTHGTFEIFACGKCGFVEWYAQHLKGLRADDIDVFLLAAPAQRSSPPATRAMRDTHVCPKCMEAGAWLIKQVREASDLVPSALSVYRSRNRWVWTEAVGTFELTVCRACGFCEWCAFERHHLVDNARHGVEIISELNPLSQCTTCAAKKMWFVATIRELPDGEPLSLPGGQGAFSVTACDACGHSEWYLHAPLALVEDPARGVTRLDAALAAKSEGPYR